MKKTEDQPHAPSLSGSVSPDTVRNTGRSGWAAGFHTTPVHRGKIRRFRIERLMSSGRLLPSSI
jgi:hypothetical protein